MLLKNKHEELFTYPEVPYYEGKTMRYLLPVLGMRGDRLLIVINNVNFSAIDILRYVGLKGIYYSWKQCPDKLTNEVYMLFAPKKKIVYTSFPVFYNYLRTIPNFIRLYHINNGVMVIAMRVDEKWAYSKEVLKTSKYSELGKKYASTFFNDGKILKKEYHIICKTDNYRRKLELDLGLPEDYLLGMELDDLFNIDKETLDLQKLNIEFVRL